MKTNAVRDLVIGFAFLGGLAILALVTLQGREPFWTSVTEVKVPFKRVDGLAAGDPVRYQGLHVGQVSRLEADFGGEEPVINVTCCLTDHFNLPLHSRFEVRSAGPLGGRLLAIIPGPNPAKVVSVRDGVFRGVSKGDLFDELGELLDEVRQGNGLVAQLLQDETIGRNFDGSLVEIRNFFESLNKGEGTIQTLLHDREFRDKVVTLVDDMSATSSDIREGKGALGLLLNDVDFRDKFRDIVVHTEDVTRSLTEGKGTLGKLMSDSSLHDSLQDIVDSAKGFMKNAEQGKGVFGLLMDPEFRDAVQRVVKHLEKALADIAEGKGTVGRLVTEDEIYERFNRILVQTEDAVEDFREQAPISTFVNALFSGF